MVSLVSPPTTISSRMTEARPPPVRTLTSIGPEEKTPVLDPSFVPTQPTVNVPAAGLKTMSTLSQSKWSVPESAAPDPAVASTISPVIACPSDPKIR
ncbi:hypothetical protein HYN69_00430 [Gemmobacter aquarius]|uniref:Uncharacterized protein n=1 Tax=Paragemmobacter aquarius TaxID=2169400 RepID=A0A2S0UH86_9RHOB|nr:hypothetical protein HYN69_00430 [Gemmobacter aquarius]